MNLAESLLAHKRLLQAFHYDRETGIFHWRISTNNRTQAGDPAGSIIRTADHSYWKIQLDRRQYSAHRLAWFYVHGEWPSAYIDHIDGNGVNNRITNLRQCTPQQNLCNTRRNKRNKSGFKGVTWDSRKGKWRAQISIFGQKRHLGSFDSPQSAHAAYLTAAESNFGEFARG